MQISNIVCSIWGDQVQSAIELLQQSLILLQLLALRII